MKRFAVSLCVSAFAAGALAQGLVNFANDPTTLVYIQYWTSGGNGPLVPIPANNPGGFYFGLFVTEDFHTDVFRFTGVYATNTADAGLFGPASYTPTVPGWAPGEAMFYEVFGWSANLGPTFNPAWLASNFGAASGYYYGFSAIGAAVAGGTTPQARLTVSISGESLVISWTSAAGTLQTSPALGVGEAWVTVGTNNPATVPISGNARFFRVLPAAYSTPNLFGPSGLSGFGLYTNEI